MNIEEIKKRIIAEALKLGFNIKDVRTKVRVDWFPQRTAHEVFLIASMAQGEQERARILSQLAGDMQPTVIKAGHEFPLNKAMFVLSIFATDDGWNVYALALSGAPGADEIRPTRYSLSNRSLVMDAEQMSLSTFISEIVNEYSLLDADDSARTREKSHIVDYLQALPPETSVREAIDGIVDDEHLPGLDDEDEELEEEEPAVVAPAAPAPPVTTPPEAATSTP